MPLQKLTPPRSPRTPFHPLPAQIKQCEPLEESELEALCGYVKEVLVEESNVQPVNSPVHGVGDIHGQFHDLLKLLETGGDVPDTNYIFMGDFVDRGYNSLESFTLLMLLKARWPQCVTLLRGNHESRQITQVYGFYDECQRKYGNANAWRWCTDVFDYLTLSALIDGGCCACTAASPPASAPWIRSAASIACARSSTRDVPSAISCGPTRRIWSAGRSPRAARGGSSAGASPRSSTTSTAWSSSAAHQLVQEGLKYMFPEKSLVTVWSAPNYCYRCGNVASMLAFDDKMERTVKYFTGDAGKLDHDGAESLRPSAISDWTRWGARGWVGWSPGSQEVRRRRESEDRVGEAFQNGGTMARQVRRHSCGGGRGGGGCCGGPGGQAAGRAVSLGRCTICSIGRPSRIVTRASLEESNLQRSFARRSPPAPRVRS